MRFMNVKHDQKNFIFISTHNDVTKTHNWKVSKMPVGVVSM